MDKYTIRNIDGTVDVNATLSNYSNILSKWISENEIESPEIAWAIDKVFDEHPNKRLKSSIFIPYVMAELNPNPEQFSAITAQIKAFIKQDRFDISVGINGGCIRLARAGEEIPAKTIKTSIKKSA